MKRDVNFTAVFGNVIDSNRNSKRFIAEKFVDSRVDGLAAFPVPQCSWFRL